MKKTLPENAKIAKEAKECVQECVSEFISFITSEASDRCQQEKRKTINGEDILWAMQSLGFENYAEALKIYLAKYREVRYWNTLVWRVIRLLSLLTNWKIYFLRAYLSYQLDHQNRKNIQSYQPGVTRALILR